jgi:Spy/CpxP family protein refolding chaperone
MRIRSTMVVFACLILGALLTSYAAAALAQESTKDAFMTFAVDLHEGVKRSTLTPQQKQQLRGDLQSLHAAMQSGNRRAAIRPMMNFHDLLDSGAFQPQDQARLKQDLQNLRAAKQASGGGMGGGMGGMGGGGMGGGMGGMP